MLLFVNPCKNLWVSHEYNPIISGSYNNVFLEMVLCILHIIHSRMFVEIESGFKFQLNRIIHSPFVQIVHLDIAIWLPNKNLVIVQRGDPVYHTFGCNLLHNCETLTIEDLKLFVFSNKEIHRGSMKKGTVRRFEKLMPLLSLILPYHQKLRRPWTIGKAYECHALTHNLSRHIYHKNWKDIIAKRSSFNKFRFLCMLAYGCSPFFPLF